MTAKNHSWFHCGRCGTLFKSAPGKSADRRCAACGRNPVPRVDLPAAHYPDSRPSPAAQSQSPGIREPRGKRSSTKRKRTHLMVKLVTGWVLFLACLVIGSRLLFYRDVVKTPPPVKPSITMPEEDLALLDETSPAITRTFSAFLAARTPEERNQFVLEPLDTVTRMAHFQSFDSPLDLDVANLRLTHKAVVHLPSKRAIETQWASAAGHSFDAVFCEENGEWRLDWNHYVRFSKQPWALFLAGSGNETGEFRLLARQRLAGKRKDTDPISIVLAAPQAGFSTRTGIESPEFVIQPDTRNGRLLDAAFQLARSDRRVFGAFLPSIDPEGFIRVRVKVRRVMEDAKRRFEIEEIVACHWYSIDAPGVDIPEK